MTLLTPRTLLSPSPLLLLPLPCSAATLPQCHIPLSLSLSTSFHFQLSFVRHFRYNGGHNGGGKRAALDLFVGDVSLSAATKSFVKRRRRLSPVPSLLPSLCHLQFLSQSPHVSLATPSVSTSPLDCCNCLSFQIVSCAKAQSQKLAQLIHEISRFISPNSCSCLAPPPSHSHLPPSHHDTISNVSCPPTPIFLAVALFSSLFHCSRLSLSSSLSFCSFFHSLSHVVPCRAPFAASHGSQLIRKLFRVRRLPTFELSTQLNSTRFRSGV